MILRCSVCSFSGSQTMVQTSAPSSSLCTAARRLWREASAQAAAWQRAKSGVSPCKRSGSMHRLHAAVQCQANVDAPPARSARLTSARNFSRLSISLMLHLASAVSAVCFGWRLRHRSAAAKSGVRRSAPSTALGSARPRSSLGIGKSTEYMIERRVPLMNLNSPIPPTH